jgi:hypothetical protein
MLRWQAYLLTLTEASGGVIITSSALIHVVPIVFVFNHRGHILRGGSVKDTIPLA